MSVPSERLFSKAWICEEPRSQNSTVW